MHGQLLVCSIPQIRGGVLLFANLKALYTYLTYQHFLAPFSNYLFCLSLIIYILPEHSMNSAHKLERDNSHSDTAMNESNAVWDTQMPAHTIPCEAGGISMIELVYSMKADAAAQENLLVIFSEMLDETVERNDQLQVCR